MTDVKDLAARLREEGIERLNSNKLYEGSGEVAWDRDDYDWHTNLLREAAAALEAQAEEIAFLVAHNAKLMDEPAKLLRTIVAQNAKIAALKQAAAPFVDAINPRMIQTDFDQDERVSVTVTVADLRALARAAGGGE